MVCRLNRLIRLIRIVNGNSYPNVQDLCHIFSIKERTLFNDLKELKEELGVDIQFDKSRRGYYLASDAAEISLMALNEETAILLMTAFGLLEHHAGDSLTEPLHHLFNDEITSCLGNGSATITKSLIRTDGEDSRINRNLFLEICRACLKKQPVKVTLNNSASGQISNEQEEKERAIELIPLYIQLSDNIWKLAYQDGHRSDLVSSLEISSIKALELNGNNN